MPALSNEFAIEEPILSDEFETVQEIGTKEFPIPSAEEEALEKVPILQTAADIATVAQPQIGIPAKLVMTLSDRLGQLGLENLQKKYPNHPILTTLATLLLSGGAALGGTKLGQLSKSAVRGAGPRIDPEDFPSLEGELAKADDSLGPTIFQKKGITGEGGAATIEMEEVGRNLPTPPGFKPEGLAPKAPEKLVGEALDLRLRERTSEYFKQYSSFPEEKEILFKRSKSRATVEDRIPRFVDSIAKSLGEYPEEIRTDIWKALDNPNLDKELPSEVLRDVKQLRRNMLMFAKGLESRGLLPEGTVDENKLSGYVHYMYAKHILGDDRPIIINKLGRLDLSETLKRNPDLSEEILQELERVEDAAIAVPTGMAKSLTDMANYDWQSYLSSVKGAVLGDPKEVVKAYGRIPPGYKIMPQSKRYGNMAGKVVHSTVVDDITPIESLRLAYSSNNKIIKNLADFERRGMTVFKTLKVPLNLPTAARNIISVMIQMAMPKHGSLSAIPKDLAGSLKSMVSQDALYAEARRNGLFRSNFTMSELKDLYSRVIGVEESGFDKFMEMVTDSVFVQYYGKIDDVAKHAIYTRLRKKGISQVEALYEAQKWGMDYSLAPKSIKEIRTHAIPFVSYSYKVAPLILETMKTKPWFIPAITSIGLGSEYAAQSINSMTDEQWKSMKASLPGYIQKHKTFAVLPYKDEKGSFKWIEYNYFLPWGQWMDVLSDINQKEWGELKKDFPLFNPITAVTNNLSTILSKDPPIDPFTERPIFNPLDSKADQWAKTMEYIINQWSPKMLQRFGALGTTLGDRTDKWGRETTDAEAAVKWIGVNITKTSPSQVKALRERRLKELNVDLNKILKDPTVDIKTKRESSKRFIEKKREIVQGPKSKGMIQDLMEFLYMPLSKKAAKYLEESEFNDEFEEE